MGCLSRNRNRVWWKRSFLPCVVGRYGLPVIGCTPSAFTCATSWPSYPRRDGFSADPLSVSSRCGTPCAAMPLSTTAIAASEVYASATRAATAYREWSSMSWKITHLRPPARTYSVASSCQHAFGAGYTYRRNAARGFFRGSSFATPASRKIRASDATDGAVIPKTRIFSCTLIGP